MFTSIQMLFSLFVLTNSISASEVTPWKKALSPELCQKEFQLFAETSGFDKDHFRQIIGESYDETVYRNLSDKIGNWSEIHLFEKKNPFILKIEDNQITKHSFDKSCVAKTELVSWPAHLDKVLSRKLQEDWSNDELRALVDKNKSGIIYSWSPKFTYSVLALPQMEKLANAMGFEFTAVVDPRASRAEILASIEVLKKKMPKSSLKKMRMLASDKKFNRNISTDLFMRAAFNHYPITYVYHHKKIHPRFVVGVMTDNGLKEIVKTYAGEL